MRIDPSGRLLDSFIDLNTLRFSRFHVPPGGGQVPWNALDIEDRNRAESLGRRGETDPPDGG